MLSTMETASGSMFVEYASAGETTAEPPIDMHNVVKTGNMPATTTNKNAVAKSLLEIDSWLPFAAEAYNISASIKDFLVVPTTIFLTDLPNANLAAFPFEEMSRWNSQAGMISYKTWQGKPCVAAGALVPTEKGLIEIQDISRLGAKKVQTKDGVAKIKNWIRNGYAKIHVVTTQKGKQIRVTDNHPFLVLTDKCILKWKNAGDLQKNDVVVISTTSLDQGDNDLRYAIKASDKTHDQTFEFVSKTGNVFEKVKHQTKITNSLPSYMTKELSRILGYLVSEGHIGKNIISFNNTDKELIDDFIHCWEKSFNEKPSLYIKNRKDAYTKGYIYEVRFSRQDVIAYLNALGYLTVLCGDREVPVSILKASKEFRKEFLKAYIEGDGCVSSNRIQMHSISEKLIRQLQILAESIGFSSRISLSRKANKKTNRKNLWKLVLEDSRRFVDEVGLISSRRYEKIKEWRKNFKDCRANYIPYAKEWSIAVAAQHATSGGPNIKYWDYKGNQVEGNFGIGMEYAKVAFDKEAVVKFAPRLGILNPQYAERLNNLAGDFVFDKIESVRYTGLHEPVYDIETTASQFVANGIVIHNCHVEHKNDNPAIAAGVIFDSSLRAVPNYVGGLHRVVLLAGWDRNRYPEVANKILSGRTGFSMGSWVSKYTSSVSGLDIRDCPHFHRNGMPNKLEVGGKLVYRIAHGVTGFELSSVATPAWRGAWGQRIDKD